MKISRHPPKVSVCIPAFRGAPYIDAAIQSVLAQSFADLELIVVDDASPDSTYEIALRYATDPRVRVIRNPHNLGPAGNWNHCVSLANGDYIKVLPQDDVLARSCLERQIAALSGGHNRQFALTFSAREIMDARGRILMRRTYRRSRSGQVSAPALTRQCIRHGTNLIGEPGAVLFRRDLMHAVGPFDASIPYVIDLDYWLRLLEHGDAYYISEPLASFRISGESWSVAIGREQSGQFCRFIDKIAARMPTNVSVLDIWIGKSAAALNGLLRFLLYRVVVKRDKSGSLSR